ncbi:MAG: hypothetical protein RJA22_2083 [Verrucomicrobiota bacterium]
MKFLSPSSDAARHLSEGRYVIRSLDAAGLAAVTIPWMREAGWNPGRHDAQTFPVADPAGFLVGELDGHPIATVSGVRYDNRFAFLGCYLVAEGFRGRGYGLAIHEAARTRLAGCTQGGDGVLANVELYQRIGRVYAHRNARYEGTRPATVPVPAMSVVPAATVPWEELEALDRACFPAARTAFLRAWVGQPDSHALAVPGGAGSGAVRAYGVIRQCFRGWKIGPLFARDPEAAEAVFLGLLGRIPAGDPYVLDAPETNVAALALVGQHGLTEVFATARMYTGPFPCLTHEWIYGITTFELG